MVWSRLRFRKKWSEIKFQISQREKKIWHHQDTTFNTPKVYLDIVIKNPAFTSSPEGHVLTRIYAYLLNDYFAPYLYQDRHQFDSLERILERTSPSSDHLDEKSRHYWQKTFGN